MIIILFYIKLYPSIEENLTRAKERVRNIDKEKRIKEKEKGIRYFSYWLSPSTQISAAFPKVTHGQQAANRAACRRE